jgi:hypothetical protein
MRADTYTLDTERFGGRRLIAGKPVIDFPVAEEQ